MASLLRILEIAARLPDGLKVVQAAKDASKGDPEALLYLKQHGWKDAVGIYSPSLREAAESAVPKMGEGLQELLRVMRGETGDYQAKEEAAPWADFAHHLPNIGVADTRDHKPAGAMAIFGSRGEGKTTLAKKLAWIFNDKWNYDVVCVNFDPKDMPDWAERVSMEQITEDVETIVRYVNPPVVKKVDLEEEEDPKKKKKKVERPVTAAEIKKLSHRVVIFDEASMAFGQFARGGKLKARATAAILMNYCRHVDTIVIYIGQMLKQLPKELRTDTIMFFKLPDPEIERQDGVGDDNAYCREKWGAAKSMFETIRTSTYYEGEHATTKAWAYVAAGKIGGHSFYGAVPFVPAPDNIPDIEIEDMESET